MPRNTAAEQLLGIRIERCRKPVAVFVGGKHEEEPGNDTPGFRAPKGEKIFVPVVVPLRRELLSGSVEVISIIGVIVQVQARAEAKELIGVEGSVKESGAQVGDIPGDIFCGFQNIQQKERALTLDLGIVALAIAAGVENRLAGALTGGLIGALQEKHGAASAPF